jgi:subtilisin family serine protease
VLVDKLPPGPIHVAADRRAVAITSPEAGQVRLPAPFEGSVMQKGGSSVTFTVWDTRAAGGASPERLPQKRVPADVLRPILRPGDALLSRGSLFLVDEATASVYVALKEQSRWTRVAPGNPVARPAALLAVSESLLVLDGQEGVLSRWPLPVPTDVDMGRDIRSALEGLYAGLFERRALATRPVRWRGTLDQTLAEEKVWEGAPSSKVASVVCGLNPESCRQGRWQTPTQVLVPDVPTERVVDLETIDTAELEGRTLGEELNRRIVSPTFQEYRTAEELLELNASRLNALHRESTYGKQRYGPYSGSNILNLAKGDFPQGFNLTMPTEKQRALVALPRAHLREDGWLNEIRLASPGFNWVPLEETEAKANATDPQPPPSPAPPPPPCDMAELRREREELAKTINAALPPNLAKVKVGVLEDSGIDFHHPAFGGANVAFSFIAATPSPPPPTTAPPTCATATTADDHGTAVAGLIASREASLAGFAPHVQIVPLGASDEAVGQDLFQAWRDQKVRIFNLSLHYDKKLVTNIRQKINELDALFVVAAGNDATDQKQVCESAAQPYPAYPVCEGERKNVLVVAATTLQGDALIDQTTTPRAGGSNWNPNVVQIAAPGMGYHAPTRNNGYAPVRGTSFATPLVTATAALLFAQGVKEPALIKQRIIATSDPKIGLLGKVFAAGLLNVQRAVTAPQNAVLSRGDITKRVDLLLEAQTNAISIKWSGGSRTLPLANVRRLTKNLNGQSYRIIYLDDVTGKLIVQEIDPGSWPVKYQALDTAGQATGNPVSDQLENYDDYVGPIT